MDVDKHRESGIGIGVPQWGPDVESQARCILPREPTPSLFLLRCKSWVNL